MRDAEKEEKEEGRNSASASAAVPAVAQEAVLVRSAAMPATAVSVRGYDFNDGLDYAALLAAMHRTGFQATQFGRAVDEVNAMLAWRPPSSSAPSADPEAGEGPGRTTVFLAYTSNLVSSGVRESIRFLAQHGLVSVLVTTAGGIEEDLIKCLAPTYLGDFELDGRELRRKGLNRIGNLLVPNDNYCKFEDWFLPQLDVMLEEQRQHGVSWTPSKVIERLGRAIDHPDSICYWAARNGIPVFCPALTDGSLGDMLYFHSYRNPGLRVDIVEDVRRINTIAVRAPHTGMVILGGGVVKHHVCNANLMRNGADHAVFINTANEFDGSDAGARPDEAISWGKIRMDATPVKVYGDATLLFPLLVAETFAKQHPPPSS